jgi:hypothetical protein
MQVPRTGLRKGGYIVFSSIKQVAKGAARFTIGTVKWGGILGLLSFALIETPGAAKITNDVLRAVGKLPKPTVKPLEPKEFIGGKPVDMFAAGFDEFPIVQKAINEATIVVKAKGGNLDLKLDSDNSGWVLDKPAEIESLISILKAADKEKFEERNIFHFAPGVCLKFRGIRKNKQLLEQECQTLQMVHKANSGNCLQIL